MRARECHSENVFCSVNIYRSSRVAMTEFQIKEKQLLESEACKTIASTSDKEVKKMLEKAATYAKKKDWTKNAVLYGVLATIFKDNANYALLAARQYRKGECIEDSARWFLRAAELFAQQMFTAKAISALRMFEQLKPETGLKYTQHIYDLCKEGTNVEFSYLNQEPVKTKPSLDRSSFRNSELFSAFDEENFDVLFKSLKHKKLHDKAFLAQVGEEAKSLYIVASGGIYSFISSHNKRKCLGEIRSDQICGLIPYFTGGGRGADLIANGETEVLELSYKRLDKFKRDIPAFSAKVEELYEEHLLTRQLAISDVFESESLKIRRWVASKMKPMYLPKGAVLFKEGQKTRDLYLVRFGELKVTLSVGKSEHFKKTIVPGGFAGETSIATNNKRTATVRALTDCVLMELSAEDYNKIYQKSETLQKTLQRIRQTQAVEALNAIKHANIVKGDALGARLFEEVWQEPTRSPM